MWMGYAAESWTKAEDLQSAVQRLKESLHARAFDADHESVYGRNYYFDEVYYKELARKFELGAKICECYLIKQISIGELCEQFVNNELKDLLYEITHFLSKDLLEKVGIGSCDVCEL